MGFVLVTEGFERFGTLISPAALEGLNTEKTRCMVLYTIDDTAVGTAVFAAGPVTSIFEINTAKSGREGDMIKLELLDWVTELARQMKGSAIAVDTYLTEMTESWRNQLFARGFVDEPERTAYSFKLKKIADNPMLKKTTVSGKCIGLNKTTPDQRKKYDALLKRERLFSDFCHPRISDDLSSVCVENGDIEGALLVSRVPEGLYIEYLHMTAKVSTTLLAELLLRSINEAMLKHGGDMDVMALTINDNSSKLMKKLLPHAGIIEITTRYSRYL